MLKIQFLGTAAAVPAKERNVSSLIIQMLQYENEVWMIDCGEGTQQQLLHTPYSPGKISKIFITHLHGDHIFGLPGLISSRSFQGATTRLQLIGPRGVKEFLENSLKISKTYIRYPLEIMEIDDECSWKSEHFSFQAIKLDHGLTSFGYRITEKDLPGKLNVEALKKLGIPPGAIYQRLKGGETITLVDGRKINGAQFVGPAKKGKIIAVAGDTKKCSNQQMLAKNATVLIHEGTFLQKDYLHAQEHYHSTVFEAAELAKESNVKALFINHLSSRYSDATEALENEARKEFANSFIANDLQHYFVNGEGKVLPA